GDERLLCILVEPESERGSFTGDRRAIEGIRAVIQSLRPEFPDVEVGVTGKPALSNDEMTAAFRDSERATLLAFALTLGLLLAAFARFGKPVLMLLVLTTSLCWALGLIAGTAILLSWVAMITVFPATLVLVDHRHARRPSGSIPRVLALERVHVPLVERIMTYPKTVLAFTVVLTGVSVWGLTYIQF